jgi:hypothetical protein
MSRRRTDARIRRLAAKRLEPDEAIVGWARVWYSRAVRLQVFAARYRDIVVLTDRRLMLFEVGWFTRVPRRRVLADRLDDLTVEDVSRVGDVTTVRFAKAGHRSMLLHFDRGDDAALGRSLLATAGRRVEPPEAPVARGRPMSPSPEDDQ